MSSAIGTQLPPGHYEIEPWEDLVLRKTIGAPPAEGDLAHPLWGYVAAQNGIGTDVEGLLAPVDAHTAEGTMLASCEIDYRHELRTGVRYETRGEILDLQRKKGKRTGPFDLYTFRIDLVEPAGETAASLTACWVLPRRGAGDE